MTKSKPRSKLVLATQTLVHLTSSQLEVIAGGSGATVGVCCPAIRR